MNLNTCMNEPINFRPISLLPVLSKIKEKVIPIQLIGYLEYNKLINDSDYAYRRKFSTEDSLLLPMTSCMHNRRSTQKI